MRQTQIVEADLVHWTSDERPTAMFDLRHADARIGCRSYRKVSPASAERFARLANRLSGTGWQLRVWNTSGIGWGIARPRGERAFQAQVDALHAYRMACYAAGVQPARLKPPSK